MKLFNSLCCTTAYRMLVIFALTSCLATIANSQNLKSNFLPPGSIIFRAFDNNIDGNGKDYIALTSLVYLETGDKFSLTNAKYVSNTNSTHWEAAPRNSFSSIEFQYLGIEPLEPSTNFCFYIGIEGAVNVIDIFINGEPGLDQFGVSESVQGNTSNINLSSIDPNSLYITQGEWYEENGNYNLSGNVIDGINIGSSLADWQQTGIPNEIGGTTLSTGNTPGDYYGILSCNGAVYVCDFTDIQPLLENWLISTQTDPVDLDPQEFCDHLCDVICDDCAFDVDIFLDNNCNLIATEVACEAPYQYNWQRLQDGEWVNISVSTSQDGSIDPLIDVYSDYTYRLVIYCDQYCTNESEPINPLGCGTEPCLAEIEGFQSSCYLWVTVDACVTVSSATSYQWFELIDGIYSPIWGATQSFYNANSDGQYRVEVSGCNFCPDLFWEFILEEIEIDAAVNIAECCDYYICLPIIPNTPINNIVLFDGTHLNQSQGFNFPYLNQPNSLDNLVTDINNWLDTSICDGQAYWTTDTSCNAKGQPFGIALIITNALPDLFRYVIFNFDQTADFQITCYESTNGHVLSVTPPCEDYTSILWSTGDQDVTTITYTGIATYHTVTITCPDGCVWESDINLNTNDDDLPEGFVSIEEHSISENIVPIHSALEQKKLSDQTYTIFPNPTLGRFSLTHNSSGMSQAPLSINILTLRGQIAAKYNNIKLNDNQTYQFDISDLTAGIYLINIIEGTQVFTQKLVLVK